jgi:NADH:ubiquinone oxidoreductase subunit E
VSSSSLSSRRLFPPEVVSHLETIFDTEKYLKDDQVAEISNATHLSDKQIRSWFKQRRYRYNQENKQNGIDIEIKKYNNLSQQVVNELEKSFRINNYVYGNDKKVLARKLNLTPVQLERWFYYRRKKQSNGTANNNNNNNVINETF